MTDQVDNTHNPTPAAEPLALRLSEGLGPLLPKRDVLSVVAEWALDGHIMERGVTCEAGDAIRAAVAAEVAAAVQNLRAALKWYADGQHFDRCDPNAWDTVSGEPRNWWCDEAGTGMVEDGTLAAKVLAGEMTGVQMHAQDE